MRRVHRSALVPYSADQMFSLVNDVESYPTFLPWCNDATVHSCSDDEVEATLELHKGSVSKHFTTLNTLHRPDAIDLALVGGPFRHLEGGWRFRGLDDEGCKVTLDLEFQFDSMIVDMMFGSFFEETCNSLVDAFTRQARAVYGKR